MLIKAMSFFLQDLLCRRYCGTVMECHIQPDWLLIWVINEKLITLTLTDTGTHSDLY